MWRAAMQQGASSSRVGCEAGEHLLERRILAEIRDFGASLRLRKCFRLLSKVARLGIRTVYGKTKQLEMIEILGSMVKKRVKVGGFRCILVHCYLEIGSR